MTPTLTLPAVIRHGLDRMAGDLVRVFEARFIALVATGVQSSVVFADPIGWRDLEALGPLTENWHRDGLHTPLLLTPHEFRRSIDAFPLEYQAIVDRHVVVAGTPPFQDIVVDTHHLRRACEVQAKGHLLHLRQGWLDRAGHDEELADLITESAEPLRAVLANVARLQGHRSAGESAALVGAEVAGLDVALVTDVLALESAPERAGHLVPRMPDYLRASERLWSFVDTWVL